MGLLPVLCFLKGTGLGQGRGAVKALSGLIQEGSAAEPLPGFIDGGQEGLLVFFRCRAVGHFGREGVQGLDNVLWRAGAGRL